MPPRRRLLIDPSTLHMPDFASRGYAPSRARQRRIHACNNQEAIQILRNEWTARNQLEIQRWERENLPSQQAPPAVNELDDNGSQEQQLLHLVHNLQQGSANAENATETPAQIPDVIHPPNDEMTDGPNFSNPSSQVRPNQSQPQSSSQVQTADPQQQQQQPQTVPSIQPPALNTLNNNDVLQTQLETLLQQLQRQANPENLPPNPPFANPFPSSAADHNSNSNPDENSTASSTSLARIKLGRNVHDVMNNFHLLPLPVLEELRHMRHVKLWFFTNDGLEKTRSAKERSGRYNSSRVRFDFERQGLVAENEYEATVKTAPEDNTLTPDQLNQAMPRFLDSIKHANWPEEISRMFSSFFDEVQRHYESRARPIAGAYTIAQAVFELRNKFHAHLKHHREALVLSLDSSELERIREQLRAARDDQSLLFDSYRSAQREPFLLFQPSDSWALTSKTSPPGPPKSDLLAPPPRPFVLSASASTTTLIKPVLSRTSSAPVPPPSVTVQGLAINSRPATGETCVSPSSCKAANENTLSSTHVPPAAPPPMALPLVISKRRHSPLHPFDLSFISSILCDTPLSAKYPTILESFRSGFLLGVPPIHVTFTPPNNPSLMSLYSEFETLVNKEFLLLHYLGPFSRVQLEQIIGPFQTSPLSLVPKPNSSKFRLIQNLSYPHLPFPVPSINSHIDSSLYPSTFGTFLTICLVINYLPAGAQACTRDVADAYRTIPLHPSQWNGLVIKLNHDSFALNTQNCFGLASAGGVWGQVADLLADLFRSQGIGPISKWVDDFLFFRVPLPTLAATNHKRELLRPTITPSQHNARKLFLGPPLPDNTLPHYDEDFSFPLAAHNSSTYSYTEADLDAFSSKLGLPWKPEKSTPFSSTVTYLGFVWDLEHRVVTLHTDKQEKYTKAIHLWLLRSHHTLRQVQSLYGKLLHTTYIVPFGRLYLTNLEKMIPMFSTNPDKPHRPIKTIASDLDWWLQLLSAPTLSRDIPTFESFDVLQGYSDASNQGLGIVFANCWASFAYSSAFKQRNRNIAWAEASALELLILSLDYFPISTRRIVLFCDNSVVSEGWQIGRSRSSFVNDVFKRIQLLLQQRQLQLQLRYVPTTLIMTSYGSQIPTVSLTILDCARFLLPTYLPCLNTTTTLSQANSYVQVDPHVLRPHVLALERLEKWLPAVAVRSSVPKDLLEKQKQLALSAYAKSTRATYGTGLAKFHEYCDTIGLPETARTPASTTIMAGFVTYLSGMYSRTAINNFLAGVKAWHVVNNLQLDLDEKLLQTLLKGAARIQPLPLPKRLPLTTEQMERILEKLDVTKPEQAAVAACLTTTFYSCARLGEFTVPSLGHFDPKLHITIAGVSFQQDRFFNRVTAFHLPVTKSKLTGETVFWAPQNNSSNPLPFLLNHLRLNENSPQEHLFAFKTRNGKTPLTRNNFLRIIKQAAAQTEISFTSGHSLRIGSTLEYLLRGVPFEVVKQIGRWSSNAFTLYLREHGRILAPYLQTHPPINSEFLEYRNINIH
ncbi:reverse transcriptase ribonuclease H [Pyrrhoderma noxium]|uniref:Reverse transcriptase ribonuclease H n=1 Tax=Pyrrhoderma noxium TaxID=2282107 RepID=A0A286UQ14_9AGAM|nr:reverse transcriptase ribonuclease H [Pyrrhoderma noxium]